MMTDYQIQAHTRRCAVSGRELKSGERYFTALIEEGDRFERKDYSPEAWPGPPPGTFGFWTGRVPTAQEPVRPRFDDDLLEECFHRLADQTEPAKIHFRYVVALLLIRRKRLKFEQTVTTDGEEHLRVSQAGGEEKFDVVNPCLNEEQMAQVQEEVFRVLGWQ